MYKQYNEKEKQHLVNEVVVHGKAVADVSTSHGVSISTLHRWVNEVKSIKSEETSSTQRNQLESEIKLLTKERETLMHAMAIFARNYRD